jgi:hypothetical protein
MSTCLKSQATVDYKQAKDWEKSAHVLNSHGFPEDFWSFMPGAAHLYERSARKYLSEGKLIRSIRAFYKSAECYYGLMYNKRESRIRVRAKRIEKILWGKWHGLEGRSEE